MKCQFVMSQETVKTITTADTVSFSIADTTRYYVGTISITGNKKTKTHIILRELPFSEGEQYPLNELVKKFEDARRQLMNTTLFHSAEATIKNFQDLIVNIKVEVKERWYFFPSPYFKPVDRNWNQWIVEQKADFNRVNYGVRIKYYNATGRNDAIKASVGGGYTRQFSLNYNRSYFDKKLKWGYAAGFSTGKNREVNYNTINDKQVFVKDENAFLSNFSSAYALLTYRRKIKTRHSFGISWTSGQVKDTVISLNPAYLKAGTRRINYPEFFYNISYYNLDYIPYPTKGYAAELLLSKRGINHITNMWRLVAKSSGNWHIGQKMFFNQTIYGVLKFPFRQPYYNQQLMGYGDANMQGYEYYVVDGVAGGFLKSTLYHELVNTFIRIPPVKKGREPWHIPFRIVGKVYGNAGYVHNPRPGDNFLSNKMLYSGGFGIDIVSFYDIAIRLEYSFNQLGENGLFLHRKSIF
ncbi:MAG TPA: POTRA domain-containing protein [Chitinophagaceae bacterium]|nr:POTRA domain-containing protein [Chitinophagaceae bacterium]